MFCALATRSISHLNMVSVTVTYCTTCCMQLKDVILNCSTIKSHHINDVTDVRVGQKL